MDNPRQVAFLSMDDYSEFCVYDHLLNTPLASHGWQVSEVSWRDQSVDWNQFDVVIIRTPWDYQDDVECFMQCLHKIDQSDALLENSLQIVEWNIRKTYLADLERKGVAIVPTIWFDNWQMDDVAACFAALDSREIIVKPQISANADDTYRLTAATLAQRAEHLQQIFADKALMVQPFISNIVDEGEYSLFYFGGRFSHAILKVPGKGDFRVQEEHGGMLKSVNPDSGLKEAAAGSLAALPEMPLYARLDFVRYNQGFAMMEAELIEPSLYFNMDAQSPERFTEAFVARFGSGN